MTKIIETGNSFLALHPFNEEKLLSECVEEIKNKLIKNPPVKIRGRYGMQHRSVGFFSNASDGYYYSGQFAKSNLLTPHLDILLKKINKLFNIEFNGILINFYADGNDYIGAHSDNEYELSDIGVISVSYGAIRTFRIRNKINKNIYTNIKLMPNELLHMGGRFQKEFTHEIPKERTVKSSRYSFTFRSHKN